MKKTLVILLSMVAGLGIVTGCSKNDNTNDQESTLCGGYTNYRPVTDEDLAVWKEYYKGEEVLTPIEVATQVVAGTNYRFRCLNADGDIVLITLFVPLP